MDMDTAKSCSSNKFHFKYASSDAIHNPSLKKKKFAHVQSKVKVYIDNIRKEDRERRAAKLTRYRSEPTELSTSSAHWEVSSLGDDGKKVNESSSDWKLLLQEKDKEVDQMRNYADLMSKMLWSERTESCNLRYQLDEVRAQLHHSRRIGGLTLQTTDYHLHSSESVDNASDVEYDPIDTDNDETILLEVSPSTVQHKNMKYRLKKLLRCCAPCISNKDIDKEA